MAAGSYTLRKTYVDGDILSAADYVADHQQHIDNQDPQHTDDYSLNLTQMRTYTDTGDVNTESLATTLAGELERLRYQIKHIKEKLNGATITQWYSKSYSTALPAASVTSAKLADGATSIQALRATNTGNAAVSNASQSTVMTQVITTSRTRLRAIAHVGLFCGAGDALSHTITVRLKRGATVLATKVVTYQNASASLADVRPAECSFVFYDTPGVGAATYTATAQTGDAAAVVFSTDSDMLLEEIA